MTLLNAFLLGILQGLTEFIPVSSTAHLLITQWLLSIPPDDATFAFLVIVQLGTILSLLVYFWKDIWKIISAFFGSLKVIIKKGKKDLAFEARLGWLILLATVPALLAGYLLKDLVEELFKLPLLEAAIRLLTAALLLLLAELLGRRTRALAGITWLDSLVIGIFQVISVFPGASRSATTISAGMLRGFDRRSAARFAFLMSIPVMLAAGGYELLKVAKMPGLGLLLPALLVGFLTAALVGWVAVRWLISYLTKHSLVVFSAYCGVIGILCLIFSFIKG